MLQNVRAAIASVKGQPAELADDVIPDPGPPDVVVALRACGVCHTDLAHRDGAITDEYAVLLGHEAAGVIESIGSDVAHVAVGDFVVLNWRAVSGQCRACKRGRPWHCFDTFNASVPMTLTDGTESHPGTGHRPNALVSHGTQDDSHRIDDRCLSAAVSRRVTQHTRPRLDLELRSGFTLL